MLKRFEVIGLYDDGACRPMTLPRARYRSYDEALRRLDRERCIGSPGAYGIVALPTRSCVHPPAREPRAGRDFYGGELCRCPGCGVEGPTHPASDVFADAGIRRRRCLACGALVALAGQGNAEPCLLGEPRPLEPAVEPEPVVAVAAVEEPPAPELPVAVDAWPRFAAA